MTPDEGQLTVNRTSSTDVQHRQIIMSVDDQPFATLLFGQSATKPIAPGHHKLRAYNTLVWKNVEFDVAPGEHVEFQVINRPGRWTYLLVTLLGVGPIYLTIERVPQG
ncbi:MAG: hypothetical protein EPO35_04705 [Acidobacteria bacterium]|nr:MAG: hypothetical protein EPO35_04705 [Acidobacteriota bacterium]